jgi:hypothetical protein
MGRANQPHLARRALASAASRAASFSELAPQNVAALQDRGHVLLFQPGAAEVHRKAGTWFNDPEIYEWFAANLHRVREPSLRNYVPAKELKAAKMDWTEVLASEA